MITKKKTILSLATITALSVMTTVPTFAFGDYEGSNPKRDDATTKETQAYKDWYNNEWDNNEEKDSGKIILTPGVTEDCLNFAWYSETNGTPQVRISKNADMSNAKTFNGEATEIDKTNGFDKYYSASNKVTINNYFEENTRYYYQYSVDGTNWSDAYEYTTHSFTNYQAILVGDPQIGASGSTGQGTLDDENIALDTYAWNNTLETALGENGIAKDASLIISAGDQIDYSTADKYYIREQEYAGYLYPSVLRSIPVANTIGNHESYGDDYSLHYNNPNASELGSTVSGGDYYYSYGNTLYIVLNSNNRNVEEHRQLMQEAVESDEDATWRIVMFHHDIYGSASSHSDIDAANLRILFAPLMDEFNIDVCFTGHDHSYTRTFQILDGKVITTDGVNEGTSTAYNPEGTLYIAAGSASGSKFYTPNAIKQYYVAERSTNPLPTFSTIDFTENSLTIKTYDSNGDKYAYDVTIKKDDQATSIEELQNAVEAIDQTTITSGSQQRINDALANVKELLDERDDSKAIELLSTMWNLAEDPLDYYAYAQNGYKNTTSKALKQGFSTLLDKTLYENNTNEAVSSEAIQKAYDLLLTAKEEVVSKEEYTQLLTDVANAQKTLAGATIGNNKGEYTAENVKVLQGKIADIVANINESTLTKTELDTLSESLTNAVKTFEASVNAENKVEDITPADPNADSSTTLDTSAEKITDTEVINTGDHTNLLATGFTAVVSMLGIAALGLLKKKEKEI